MEYPFIEIANRKIGIGHPCFIVAELSGNHLQNFDRAVELIRASAEAGADAIKLQTYTPDTITVNSNKEWFWVAGKESPEAWNRKTLYQLYQTAYTPWEWQPKLKKIAEDLGLILFSTPFDPTAVDFLEKMDVPCYKIASYEAMDIPLIKKIAETGKPVIISVGFSTLEEVVLAYATLRAYGNGEVAILHCVTGYSDNPDPSCMKLGTIRDIHERLQVVSGFSDNNAGIEIPIAAAIGAGASIIEKHVTLRRSDGGPDARFSIQPEELAKMVRTIREAELALSGVHYGPRTSAEQENKDRFVRSLFVVEDIKAGEKFTPQNIRSIRPAHGLPPKFYWDLLGRTAAKDIERYTPLSWELVA